MGVIFFVIELILAVLILSRITKLCSYLYINIVCLKRKIKRNALAMKTFECFLYFIVGIFLIRPLAINFENLRKLEQTMKHNKSANYTEYHSSEELLMALESDYFIDEVTNEIEVLWVPLIYNNIGLSNYITWEEETNSFDELRGKYLASINSLIVPSADLTEICSNIKAFFGTSFTSDTTDITRSLEKVTDEIREKNGKKEVVSPELYAEELYLRSLICKRNSAEALHQLGRSADDTLKQTVNKEDNIQSIFEVDNKTLIFFSSIAIASYQLELEQYGKKTGLSVTKKDIALIYYRMAEIYIYLDKHCSFTGNYSFYHQHFKLSAEACLARAQSEYDPTYIGLDMNKEFPYFDDYYAELLSYFIIQYGAHEDGIIDEFYDHANKYINSPHARKNNVKNCQDLITRMDVFLEN